MELKDGRSFTAKQLYIELTDGRSFTVKQLYMELTDGRSFTVKQLYMELTDDVFIVLEWNVSVIYSAMCHFRFFLQDDTTYAINDSLNSQRKRFVIIELCSFIDSTLHFSCTKWQGESSPGTV